VAAVVGLSIAGFALHQANRVLASLFGGQLPFWLDFNLSPGSILYAGGLAVLAAVITGVLPALKATGAQVQSSLQQLSAGSGSMRLGRAWTALIIGQVAITVALLPMAVFQAGEMYRYGTVDAGFPPIYVVHNRWRRPTKRPSVRATPFASTSRCAGRSNLTSPTLRSSSTP
jgi:hypothetical protein